MTPAPAPARGWLVSPAFDLLFLANLGWPLLLLPGVGSRADTAVDFWQVYFLTVPHRWITLLLVAADPPRRAGQARRLVVVAVAAALLVGGAYLGTGAFVCLALVDYLWNAWHFASQHAGVLRMYARKVGGGSAWLERWGLRVFVTYGAGRAAGWTTGWLEGASGWRPALAALDLGVLLIPLLLLATNLVGVTRDRLGKLAYLGSVCVLYTGFLLGLHFEEPRLIVPLAAAGSLFHAAEYLAVVTLYARRRTGGAGAFAALARRWLLFLGPYVTLVGAAGAYLARPDSGWATAWVGLNLWAALVHYAYDGMIWKLRRPDTARDLGVADGPGGR